MLTLFEQLLPLVIVYEIVVVPAERPVTTPLFETVATVGAELLHTPESVTSLRAVVLPTQTLFVPPMAAGVPGSALTVRTFVAEFPQPEVIVYLTVTVPAVSPVTTPPLVMLAVPVPGTIDHVPPPVASVKAGNVEFTQTEAAPPLIVATFGRALIVSAFVAEFPQPEVIVYLTVTDPAVSPVTTPPLVMLAVPVPGTIDHVQPPVASVKAGVVEPTQTEAAPPPMLATVGNALTVVAVDEVAAEASHPPEL